MPRFIFAGNLKPSREPVRRKDHFRGSFKHVADVLKSGDAVSILYTDGTRDRNVRNHEVYEVESA